MAMYLNGVNLSFGQKGESGKSAYAYAQEQGYSGTEAEFGEQLSNAVAVQMLFGKFNNQVTWNDDETVFTETWTYNNDSYKRVSTIISDTETTVQLTINDVNAGLWTMVIDETNKVYVTTYTAQ